MTGDQTRLLGVLEGRRWAHVPQRLRGCSQLLASTPVPVVGKEGSRFTLGGPRVSSRAPPAWHIAAAAVANVHGMA